MFLLVRRCAASDSAAVLRWLFGGEWPAGWTPSDYGSSKRFGHIPQRGGAKIIWGGRFAKRKETRSRSFRPEAEANDAKYGQAWIGQEHSAS